MLNETLQDLRYGLRMLRKSPAFAVVVVLSLGLGIGANTAIFSLIDAVMWQMLPVQNPKELLKVGRTTGGDPFFGFTFADFRRLRDQTEFFQELVAYSPVRVNVSVNGSTEPTAEGQLVTGNYFTVLGVRPAAGRTIGIDDDRKPYAHPVAMISYGYWKRRFGSAPSIVGRTISLSGTPFTIIGVTPREFFGLEVGTAPDIFAPTMMQPVLMPASENLLANPILIASWLRAFGRLKPGVNAAEAAAGMTVLFLQNQPPPKRDTFGKPMARAQERIALIPAANGLSALRSQFSQPLIILMAVVGVVLLIACANIANLLLARSASRRAEFAMRLALGAGRGRLFRQVLVESVLLAVLGGLCGVILARWAARLLVAFMSAGRSPIVLDLTLDWRVLGFTAAVSILTGIVFGLVPAIRSTRLEIAAAVKGKSGGPAGGSMMRPGKALAVTQVALSLVLLIGAGVFVRSLQNLNRQDGGFQRDSVLLVRVEPKGSDQRNIPGTSERLDRAYRDLLQRVEAIHGVRAASMAHFTPTSRVGFSSPLKLQSGEEMRVSRLMVYPNYFATMSIPIVAGRDFNAGDLDGNSPGVAVVNEAFARSAFKGASAVGQQYMSSLGRRGLSPVTIIGVVKDTRYASLRSDTPPLIYQPFFQTSTGRGQMVLHVRVAGGLGVVVPRVRDAVQSADRTLPLFEIRSLADEMDAALIRERIVATLSGLFSILALLLAAVGIYGLLAFGVVQRTGEMGLRMALGARRANLVWMVMREALVLVVAGTAVGLPAAFAVARLASSHISGLLFGLKSTDPTTIGLATVVLTMVAMAAAYLPARRASTVDPMTALRNE
jgi:predicted permease